MVFTINKVFLFVLNILLCLISIVLLLLGDLFFSGIIFVIAAALTAKNMKKLGINFDSKKKINKLSKIVILFFILLGVIGIIKGLIDYGVPSNVILNMEYFFMIWGGLSWIGLFASNFLLIALNLKLINRLK